MLPTAPVDPCAGGVIIVIGGEVSALGSVTADGFSEEEYITIFCVAALGVIDPSILYRGLPFGAL